jgi:hypothetical protein
MVVGIFATVDWRGIRFCDYIFHYVHRDSCEDAGMNSNALDIKSAVVYHAVMGLRHVLVSVEPSFQSHDVWSMTSSRRQHEWEIKRSMGDLRHELDKFKHNNGGLVKAAELDWRRDSVPNYFTFVVLKEMEEKALIWINNNLPFAGMSVFDKDLAPTGSVRSVKSPQLIHSKKASLKQCSKVARWMAVSLADLMDFRAAH